MNPPTSKAAQQKGKWGLWCCSWLFIRQVAGSSGPLTATYAIILLGQLWCWSFWHKWLQLERLWVKPFGGGQGRATSVGGSVSSHCLVLLKLNSSASAPQDNNLLRWQKANKTGRVYVAGLYWEKTKQTHSTPVKFKLLQMIEVMASSERS